MTQNTKAYLHISRILPASALSALLKNKPDPLIMWLTVARDVRVMSLSSNVPCICTLVFYSLKGLSVCAVISPDCTMPTLGESST